MLKLMDPWLLVAALLLSAYGILAVYIAGSGGERSYALNQLFGLVVGFVGASPFLFFDYRALQHYVKPLYWAIIAMLVAVFLFGAVAGGARRWIELGPVQVQPSEFAKVLMVLVLSGYISEHGVSDNRTFLKTLGIICVPAFLVFAQPDLGTAIIFGALFTVMMFIGGAKFWQIGALAGAGIGLSALAVKLRLLEPYQVSRLMAFVNPEGDPETAYQVVQSKTAIGSGGVIGKGLDATTLSNLGYLPADHTDFIFANVAERLGFVGSLIMLGLFLILIWRILHIATLSRDRFGVLICVGIATIFLFHIFVNIGMTMGMMPVTGIPLPFISYGRSNLVVSLISIGVLQGIAIYSKSPSGVKSPKQVRE
jgi:rod shape determining protein RodA